MPRIEKDQEREDRIEDEALADCHDADERAIAWFYYLAESISFPFPARCIQKVRKSPLKAGELVTVTDMIYDDSNEMLAEIEFLGRGIGVPLHQLEPLDVDKTTCQVIEDWQYWVAREYGFG